MKEEGTHLPNWLLRGVGWLIPAAEREFLLGDLVEVYEAVWVENGRFAANRWFISQIVRSLPAFIQLSLHHWVQRSMMMKTNTKRDIQFFSLGVLLLVPAVLIVIPGLVSSFTGWSDPLNSIFNFLRSSIFLSWLTHPVVIMGGLLSALLLNAHSLFDFGMRREPQALVGTMTIHKGRRLPWIMVTTCTLFVTVIFLYLAAEFLAVF